MSSSPLEHAVARAAETRDRALRDGGDRWRVRGVVHTPPEVARFVVSAVDRALVAMGCEGGIADERVAIVDPACGPGAFLAAALAHAGGRPSAPGACIGVDVDADALESARALLGPEAARSGWSLELRRANTLEDLEPFGGAGDRVAVVIGNPPWAGKTANRDVSGNDALLDDFRRDASGAPLGERKIGVLSDDYVRFFRWSAEIVRRAPGGGVLGLVTNSSFLDGPVHRGMRAALARWFDAIDLYDLGGNALVAGGAERDENVFGVRPGVAITIATRTVNLGTRPKLAVVRSAELRGSKAAKVAALEGAAVAEVECTSPAYAFRHVRPVSRAYEGWMSLADAMPFHREGVQTNRDEIAIDADRERLLDRLRAFARGEGREDLDRAWAKLPHYDPERARAEVAAALAADPDGTRGVAARPIAYRPFDDRWLAPIPRLCHRPRPELLAAVDASAGRPILLCARKDRGARGWACFGIARAVPDNCWLSTRSSCRTRAFPPVDPTGRDNLAPEVVSRFACESAADFIAYVAAVISAPRYRAEFDAALRVDYPRIPPPSDADERARVIAAGERVIAAFADVARGETVEVGHVRVSSDALASAIRHADEVVAELIARAVD